MKLGYLESVLKSGIEGNEICLEEIRLPAFSLSRQDIYDAMYSVLESRVDLYLSPKRINGMCSELLSVDTYINAIDKYNAGHRDKITCFFNEQAQNMIRGFFSKNGEINFRQLEEEAVEKVIKQRSINTLLTLSFIFMNSNEKEKERFLDDINKIGATLIILEKHFPQVFDSVLKNVRFMVGIDKVPGLTIGIQRATQEILDILKGYDKEIFETAKNIIGKDNEEKAWIYSCHRLG